MRNRFSKFIFSALAVTFKFSIFSSLLMFAFLLSVDIICGLNQYLLLDMVASHAAKKVETVSVKDSMYNFKTINLDSEKDRSINQFINEQLAKIGFDSKSIEVTVESVKSPIVTIKLVKEYHGIFSLFVDSKIEVSSTAVVSKNKRNSNLNFEQSI